MNVFAMTAAFCAYFCMFAFRKPFAAGSYEGLRLLGTAVDLKTALIISQIFGYALSKYIGVKFCPEVSRGRRAGTLVILICLAEAALVLFAVVPTDWKVVAIFLNGLPLGMVWGLVVWYLEGRRTSEVLLAVLSCSFIVASGIVKDVGKSLMAGAAPLGDNLALTLPAVPEFWMPAATGLIFFPPFLASVWMLNRIPEPNELDVAERSPRATMSVHDRLHFLRRFLPGIVMLVLAYVLLTAFRDFRDNFTVDVLTELGLGDEVGAISSMETTVAFIVLFVMALLFFVKDNQRALLAIFAVVGFGMALMGCVTALRRHEMISGYWWMLLIGLGSYLGYVPYNSVMFDRLMASTRAVGTAVFAIYVADALGYSGSVVVLLFNDLFVGDMSRLEFLEQLTYFVSFAGTALMIGSGMYFLRQPATAAEGAPIPVPADASS